MADMELTGAEIVVRCLRDEGVKHIFGYPGGAVLNIYDEIYKQKDFEHILVRHEQAAVFMAEAWARMTRKPAVAMVTAGPGFTNALSGIANARLSNAPVVLIAGCVGLESAEKLDLQDMSQLPVIAPMVKKGWVCPMAERIPEFHNYRPTAIVAANRAVTPPTIATQFWVTGTSEYNTCERVIR